MPSREQRMHRLAGKKAEAARAVTHRNELGEAGVDAGSWHNV
jgi:hypothetical protein